MYRKPGVPPTGGSKIANAEPRRDDGQHGEWTRKRLIKMDERFRERVERALRHGDERIAAPEPDRK
jgi:hypothetical protein